MECGRGIDLPLQSFRTFPGALSGFFAAADGRDHDIKQQQVAEAEDHGPDAGDDVEFSEDDVVIDDSSRHTCQAEKMLWKKRDVESDDIGPEKDLPKAFVIHVSGPLGQPVEYTGKKTKDGAGHKDIMEMCDHEHAVVILHICRYNREHDPAQTPESEHQYDSDRKQHRCLECHGTAPHGGDKVEDHQTNRDGDDNGADHEVADRPQGHADGVLMMSPDHHADACHCQHRTYHGLVPEQRLSGKSGDDLCQHTDRRQKQDIDLRMPEKPEQVLKEHRVATTGGNKETGSEMAIEQQHGDAPRQHRDDQYQEEGGDQPGPAEHRHLHHCHAGSAHVEQGDDDVDRCKYR